MKNANQLSFGAYVIAAIAVTGNWAYRQFLTDGTGNLSYGSIFLSTMGITLLVMNPELFMPALLLGSLAFVIQRFFVRVPSVSNYTFGASRSTGFSGRIYDHQPA